MLDMSMHSTYFKEQQGIGHSNPLGPMTLGTGPWWSSLVEQSSYEESVGHLKSSSPSMENSLHGDQLTLTAPKTSSDQALAKGDTTHFSVLPGDCNSSANGQKPIQIQAAFTMQSAPPEHHGRLELGFGQPVMYPYGDQCYGVFSTYGHQIAGRIMLPLNLSSDNGPIFVNAKQYNGIIRRRRFRAKAEMANKVLKNRKPYLHLSRHLHAMRRPRGCGGRFLNTKKLDSSKSGGTDLKKIEQVSPVPSHPSTRSPSSEVLQSDNTNLASPREANDGGSRHNISGSEATSMFSIGNLNQFPIDDLSVASLSEMMISDYARHGYVIPNKWIGVAATSRCNFKA